MVGTVEALETDTDVRRSGDVGTSMKGASLVIGRFTLDRPDGGFRYDCSH
jgi:hypothetical protein